MSSIYIGIVAHHGDHDGIKSDVVRMECDTTGRTEATDTDSHQAVEGESSLSGSNNVVIVDVGFKVEIVGIWHDVCW